MRIRWFCLIESASAIVDDWREECFYMSLDTYVNLAPLLSLYEISSLLSGCISQLGHLIGDSGVNL